MKNDVRSVLVGLAFKVCVPGVAAGGEIFDLESAVHYALIHNPDVVTAQAELRAAEGRQHQSLLLFQSNPRIEGAAGPREGEKSSTDYSVAVSQEVEVGGQRAARGAAAQANIDATRARIAWRRVEIAATVREAFGRALAAQGMLDVAREGEGTAQQAMDAAEKRFRAGDASRIEINAARIERGRSAQARSRAEQRATLALADLQLLLALPPDQELVVRGELSPPSPARLEEQSVVVAKALDNRADVQAARAELQAARAENTLAAREWLPKPQVGAAYSHEEGDDIVQGLLGFDLPAFNRNQAGRGTASARVVQAEQTLSASRRRAEQETRLAYHRLRIAEEATAAYAGEVVSAMRENLDLSNRAYQASQIDFTQLLLLRRESLEAQRGYLEALEEVNAARAQLNRAVGAE